MLRNLSGRTDMPQNSHGWSDGPMDSCTGGKTVFQASDGRTARQPKNIMPPALKGGGITKHDKAMLLWITIYEKIRSRTRVTNLGLSTLIKQDRRWNADKPSAALDPYIPIWLTTSPANHRPANFWFFFFTFKGNYEKWCNLRSNWWASTSNLKFPFSDSFKYK